MRSRICLSRTRLIRFRSSSLRNRRELQSTVSTRRLLIKWMMSGTSAATVAKRKPTLRNVRPKLYSIWSAENGHAAEEPRTECPTADTRP